MVWSNGLWGEVTGQGGRHSVGGWNHSCALHQGGRQPGRTSLQRGAIKRERNEGERDISIDTTFLCGTLATYSKQIAPFCLLCVVRRPPSSLLTSVLPSVRSVVAVLFHSKRPSCSLLERAPKWNLAQRFSCVRDLG
ncbi:unnamed protein product, partial [Hapterophycus canaliculatus]